MVRTRDVWVQNFGRAPIREIELVFNWAPNHFEIWPQRDFRQHTNPDGRLIVKFESLGRREFFVTSLFGVGGELPAVINVRSSEGVATEVKTHVERNWPLWFLRAMLALLVIGVFSIVYFIIVLIRLFIS